MSPHAIPLTLNEALSGISGSISLAAWIFLLVPQLLENYQQGSADGISLTFLFIWFVGDVANLAGALWAGLVPTVIALAIYFCFADAILIGQCLYYNALNKRREKQEDEAKGMNGHADTAPRENTPLLNGSADTSWAIAYRVGAWTPTPLNRAGDEAEGGIDAHSTPIGASLLGYISAIAYLGARIPQILQNQRSRSCAGLSLLFFMLSLLGNATYGAGILLHSVERGYVVLNLPWLIGSLGTMVEDGVIFGQFSVFGEGEEGGKMGEEEDGEGGGSAVV
ncbi:hypothetical protein LTR32_005195 [Rachicladosporium monterosium]|uniref:Vacuolar amino acid transporter YPQ3 n=1 Tax=Rachicladosporium monterosium TaxID=1507873 RepID=A0ABR0L3N0_9PEZI|nr:hypothetical protein LTR32_005195 [Rachicladosporium monterosium]